MLNFKGAISKKIIKPDMVARIGVLLLTFLPEQPFFDIRAGRFSNSVRLKVACGLFASSLIFANVFLLVLAPLLAQANISRKLNADQVGFAIECD